MSFLLDTNVVSELRRTRVDANVQRWAAAQSPATLFISVITVVELERGISRRERTDPRQGAALRAWFDGQVLRAFAGRVIPVDISIAQRAGRLHVPDPRPENDTLIAATALERGLTVVTRNVGDFHAASVRVLNPWEA